MNESSIACWPKARWAEVALATTTTLLSACGGGGPSGPTDGMPTMTMTTTYARSVVVGASALQSIVYSAAVGTDQAAVTTAVASSLLPFGMTAVLAEHVEPTLPGLRVVCISGRGESTNVIAGINLGVVAQGAAVLFDAGWHALDAAAAWRTAVASGAAWLGWENCGVKPEGLASPSSRLAPTPAGGYAEDVFDGNPGTTFQTIRRNVASSEVAAMLSSAGLLALDDPLRPLQLQLSAYADAAGHVVFVETGVPANGALASARGFVALYVPEP
jgi:hypothetical protein